MSGNSDDKQDTYEDDQGPPIENEPIVNEEWLAFIHMSMQEVLNGETDSLKHQNLVRSHNIFLKSNSNVSPMILIYQSF